MPETRHPAVASLMRHFTIKRLPDGTVSTTATLFAMLAEHLADTLPSGPELTTGLRKLLEAKDCATRAALDIPRPETEE